MEKGRAQVSLQARLTQVEDELERERERAREIEGEMVTHDVVKEGMEKEREKVLHTYFLWCTSH